MMMAGKREWRTAPPSTSLPGSSPCTKSAMISQSRRGRVTGTWVTFAVTRLFNLIDIFD